MNTKIRARKMMWLYIDGWCLEKIGKKYGLTRERVRQILNKHYPKVYKNMHGNYKIGERITKECKYSKCGKKFSYLKCIPQERNCCNLKCSMAYKEELRLKVKHKVCSKCKKKKSVSEFHDMSGCGKKGRHFKMSICKKCFNIYSYNWKAKNPKKYREIQKRAQKKYNKLHYKEVRDRFRMRYRTDKKFRERILSYNRARPRRKR